jgi:hypothetical protein
MEVIVITTIGILVVICIVLMRLILKQENTIFDLNEKLNISDMEYMDIFDSNLKLSEEIVLLKELKRFKKPQSKN